MLNSITAVGRLTKDAEKKVMSTGTELVTFDIANNTGWGEHKRVMYFKCDAWGKIGTGIHPYLLKGKLVALTGELQEETWNDKSTGEQKRKNVIKCYTVALLPDTKPYSGGGSGYDPVNSYE
jgi:single-strand DNA-binding protein